MTEIRHRERPAAGEPEGALVLLHGRGADENDLYPLLDMLDPERRLLGVTARGPLSLPPGGAHWYAVPRVGYPDPDTFDPTWASSRSGSTRLPVPAERTVVGGFSQGAVMSYALGLGAGRPRAGRDPGPGGLHPHRARLDARPRGPRGAAGDDRPRLARPGDLRASSPATPATAWRRPAST